MMRLPALALVLLCGAAAAERFDGAGRPLIAGPGESRTLRTVESFTGYPDQKSLSIAYFEEAGRVITNPRCMNCHPAARSPTQGNTLHPHIPHVVAGADDKGAPGLRCVACHHAENTPVWGDTIMSVPGHNPWMLAPAIMAWQGRSLAQICRQISDPARNGGRSLKQIRAHMTDDTLVGWAWHPGLGRVPAPGTQRSFGALISAWMKTGAACPPS